MSIFRKTALAAALSSAVWLCPQTVLAETISAAMAKAYQNNPDLNAVRAGLRATDEGVPIAKAGYRPQISAAITGSATRLGDEGFGPGTPLVSQDYTNGSASITITQQIFDGFQTLNNVRAAEANVFSSRETLKANEISILLAAAQSYANIARDQRIVAIRKQNLAFLREQLSAAKSRLDVGRGHTHRCQPGGSGTGRREGHSRQCRRAVETERSRLRPDRRRCPEGASSSRCRHRRHCRKAWIRLLLRGCAIIRRLPPLNIMSMPPATG